ncbi:MAG: hypothetical protein IPO21_15980 [Bacteroidales bacterium]|nr:hypothetical protein [Bacteroidales bacterium]
MEFDKTSSRQPTDLELIVIKRYYRMKDIADSTLFALFIILTIYLFYILYKIVMSQGLSVNEKLVFIIPLAILEIVFMVVSYIGIKLIYHIIKQSKEKLTDADKYLIYKIRGKIEIITKRTRSPYYTSMNIKNYTLYPGFSNWNHILYQLNQKKVEMEVFQIGKRNKSRPNTFFGNLGAVSLFGYNPIETKKEYYFVTDLLISSLLSLILTLFWISAFDKAIICFNINTMVINIIVMVLCVLDAFYIFKLISITIKRKKIANEISIELSEILKRKGILI